MKFSMFTHVIILLLVINNRRPSTTFQGKAILYNSYLYKRNNLMTYALCITSLQL